MSFEIESPHGFMRTLGCIVEGHKQLKGKSVSILKLGREDFRKFNQMPASAGKGDRIKMQQLWQHRKTLKDAPEANHNQFQKQRIPEAGRSEAEEAKQLQPESGAVFDRAKHSLLLVC